MNKLVLALALLAAPLFAQSVSINGVPNQTLVGPSGTPQYIAPQAIAGCGVEYVSGLTYTVGACNYSINGVTYNSPLSNITLPAADATNPEIDVIFVDTTGVVQVIQGTPAVTPQQPVVDPSTQLQLTFVLVPATATTPANTTTVLIYDEGTEWTAAKGGTSSANVNLTSTNNPYHGTHDTEFGAGGTVATTTYAQYTKPSAGTVTLGNYNTLTLYLRNKAAWPKTRSVTVQWYNGTTPLGTAVVLSNGAYGFDATGNITSYQQISIPASTFGINGVAATTVRFTVSGSGSNLTGFYLDEVSLQGGNGGVILPTTLMNYRGSWSSTATYAPNDTVVSGGIGYVAIAANTNQAVTTTAYWSPLATSSGSGTSNPATCTVNSGTNICLNLAPYYASADGAITTTTSGTFAVGTSGSVASCSTFSANQGVDIVGAGAAGVDYIGTVVSCSGTTLTVTPTTSTSVTTGVVVKHDETAAFKLFLTNVDAGTTHSGTGYLNGLSASGATAKYLINGPAQNTGTANAIIQLPSVANGAAQQDIISIQSFNEPSQSNAGMGPVIQTDATGTVNLFGAYDAATGAGYPPFTNVNFSIKNLVLQSPTNSGVCLMNMQNAESFQQWHVLYRTAAATLPSNTNGCGFRMPLILNNVENQADDVIVAGFATGAQLTEHTHVGWMEAANNINGVVIDTGANATAPGTYFGNSVSIDYLWAGFNTCGIAAGSNDTAVNIQNLDSELSTSHDICDASNHLRGYIAAHNPYSPNTLSISGGANLTVFDLWKNAFATGVNVGVSGSEPTTNAFVGYNNSHTNPTVVAQNVYTPIAGQGAATFFGLMPNLITGSSIDAYIGRGGTSTLEAAKWSFVPQGASSSSSYAWLGLGTGSTGAQPPAGLCLNGLGQIGVGFPEYTGNCATAAALDVVGTIRSSTVATSPSTSPICPNGTGGTFTTSGCATTSNFSGISTGTNTTATMTVGAGASILPASTGVIQATNIASTVAVTSPITVTGSGTTASPYTIACPTCGTGSGGTSVSQNSGSAETNLPITGYMPQVCSDTSASGTAQSCTVANSFTPQTGNCLVYKTTTANSGTGLTVNVNSLGAKSVAVAGSSGWTTTLVASSSIPANKPMNICYDGTNWNASGTGYIPASGGGGGSTNITSLVTPTNCTITSGVCTTTGSVASVTFASIPAGYKYIQIVYNGTGSGVGSCQFNGDTAANYAYTGQLYNGSSTALYQAASQTAPSCFLMGSLTSGGTITIPFYTSSNAKTVLSDAGITNSVSSVSGITAWNLKMFWSGTAAITSVVLTDTISSGTSFVIYGGN